MRALSVSVVVALLVLGPGCKPKQPLAGAVFGSAFVSSRKAGPDKSFDDVIEAGGKQIISLHLEPPNTITCMAAVDRHKLRATANGVPMKLESAGGSHAEHPMGPDHFPHEQTVCDPIRFTLPGESIKPAADGVVMFEVTDGETAIELAWAHLFESRKLALVDHAPTLKVGEHVKLAWSPADDKLTAGGPVQACLKPPAGTTSCPRSLNGSQCTPARLTGTEIDFEVPASWTCAPNGSVWVGNVHARAPSRLCNDRFKECVAQLGGGTEQVAVHVAP